jgi:hypothetical protein
MHNETSLTKPARHITAYSRYRYGGVTCYGASVACQVMLRAKPLQRMFAVHKATRSGIASVADIQHGLRIEVTVRKVHK